MYAFWISITPSLVPTPSLPPLPPPLPTPSLPPPYPLPTPSLPPPYPLPTPSLPPPYPLPTPSLPPAYPPTPAYPLLQFLKHILFLTNVYKYSKGRDIYSKTKTFGRSWPLLIVDTYITSKGCDLWGFGRLQVMTNYILPLALKVWISA